MLLLLLVLLASSFVFTSAEYKHKLDGGALEAHLAHKEQLLKELYPDLRVSPPCANAEEIFPCTCYNYSTGRTYVNCDGILDESVVHRALHADGYGKSPMASLGISYGTISQMSAGMFSMHTFEQLWFMYNHFEYIEPGTLEPLRYDLRAIYLDNNRFTEPMIDQVLGFPYLYSFDITYNLIEDISMMADYEDSIPSLQTLDFAGNRITHLPANVFKAFPNIMMLLLSQNNISYIHPDAFSNLPNLDYLYLDGNNLNHLGAPEVGKIVVARIGRPTHFVGLEENNIESLLPGFIEGLGDPSSLALDSNPMRHFPEEVFGDLLRNLSISDAPFGPWAIGFHYNWIDCDCDFLWVAIDGWLNAHLNGGHCGNKTEFPWVSIDDVDGQALAEQCIVTTTPQPTNPRNGTRTGVEEP